MSAHAVTASSVGLRVARIPAGRAAGARAGVGRAGAPSRARSRGVPAPRPGAARRDVRAAAGKEKDLRNPATGAISDANATRGGSHVSWDDLLSGDLVPVPEPVVPPAGAPSSPSRAAPDASASAGAVLDRAVSSERRGSVSSAAPIASAAANGKTPVATRGAETGFFVRKERHEPSCACSVCRDLRALVAAAPEPSPTSGAAPGPGGALGSARSDPVFVAFDGGFVVGKQQQKHHVFGCRCPNCNNMRFRMDKGTAKVVTIDETLLVSLVGEADRFQRVLSEQTELDRRAKIGAANKGKSAWNKGRHHSPETIAKIKANTARAMRDPEVKRRMREAAAKTFHSATTKMKIRRTVRDTAHRKMEARNMARSAELGPRRGKVGMVSIGTYARRVSSVQRLSFGVWGKHAMEEAERRRKLELRALKKIEREEKKRAAREARLAEKAAKGVTARTTRGVAKSPAHRAAISAALKAKWSDPNYVAAQKNSIRTRKKSAGRAAAAATPRAPPTEAEKKRHKLVGEMKEIYTKASVALRALEERKSAGLEVDEAMLKKALSAVAETRKVLESLGQAAAPPPDPAAAKAKARARADAEARPTVVHVRNGERIPQARVGGEGDEEDAREEDAHVDIA